MRCRVLSCLAALFFAAPALAQTAPATPLSPSATPPAAVRPDLSSPKSALVSVYAALKIGDMPAAKACLTFKDASQAELFDITYSQMYVPLKLMHAMESRFGAAGRQPFASEPLERALDATLEKVKSAEIQMDGDRAVIVDKKAAINPSSESELTGITFKKEGDNWKIVAATFSDVGDGGEMPAGQMGFMRTLRDTVVTACAATSARLEKGEFKSADEAYADYQSRVQAGMQTALTATATTQK